MSQSADHTPRRSVLFVPANNGRAIAKAPSLPADAVAIDLEDAVAEDDKDAARAALAGIVDSLKREQPELWVRINATDSAHGMADLRAISPLDITGVILPKVENPDAVHRTGVLLGDAKQLTVMIETPRGVLNAAACCAAHENVRVALLGGQDLAADLKLPPDNPDRQALNSAMQLLVLAARAAGISVLDSVCADYQNEDILLAECEQARQFGFDGKAAIHPAQLDVINRTFSVSDAVLAEAEAVLASFETAVAHGKSVATLNGRMIESLHAAHARAVIGRASRERAR